MIDLCTPIRVTQRTPRRTASGHSKPPIPPPMAHLRSRRRCAKATGPEVPEDPGSAEARKGPLDVTRTASAWIGLVVGALILILLLVFVLQNNENTKLSILAWDFTLPLGVSMLFAAIAGALIMALAGGTRILQLRKAYKNLRR
jgi:uncharacterized integral membrane protein